MHNIHSRLNPRDPDYKQWIFRFTFLELEKDLAGGDVTTKALFFSTDECSASLIAGENGVLAGIQEVQYFLVESDSRFRRRIGPLELEILKNDGDRIQKDETILRLEGHTRDVLGIERVLLNILGRMSGVATATRNFVNIIESVSKEVLLCATRKTLWGLLDKRAVSVGGGFPHRLNLSDAMIVKDNHLALFRGNTSSLLEKIFRSDEDIRFVEVEVESLEQALHMATAIQRIHFRSSTRPFFLLLDNMSPASVCETVDVLKKNRLYDEVLLEASGGINLQNILEYAKTGVDVLSTSAITQGACSLNLSLEVQWPIK